MGMELDSVIDQILELVRQSPEIPAEIHVSVAIMFRLVMDNGGKTGERLNGIAVRRNNFYRPDWWSEHYGPMSGGFFRRTVLHGSDEGFMAINKEGDEGYGW